MPAWIAKRLKVAVAAIALTLGLIGLYFVVRSPRAPRYLTVPVERQDLEETVLASGTIEPLKLVSVGAQASGRILSLHAQLGDRVRRGSLIAEIDPATERNALQTAQATLDEIRAQRASSVAALHQADLALSRARLTSAGLATSQADLETAQANYAEAQAAVRSLDAQVRAAQINVDTARVTLGFTKVIAPMDGTVVAIVAQEGQTVNAVQSAPTIVKLADLDIMTVKAQISEADVMRVKPGQRTYFTTLGDPEKRYEGTLRAIEPAPESLANDTGGTGSAMPTSSSSQSNAVYYDGLFDVPNPGHLLRPSMTAEVRIVLDTAHHVLAIPLSALSAPGQEQVRVLTPSGRVETRHVHLGMRSGTSVEVLSGLRSGDRVVIGESSAASQSSDD